MKSESVEFSEFKSDFTDGVDFDGSRFYSSFNYGAKKVCTVANGTVTV